LSSSRSNPVSRPLVRHRTDCNPHKQSLTNERASLHTDLVENDIEIDRSVIITYLVDMAIELLLIAAQYLESQQIAAAVDNGKSHHFTAKLLLGGPPWETSLSVTLRPSV